MFKWYIHIPFIDKYDQPPTKVSIYSDKNEQDDHGNEAELMEPPYKKQKLSPSKSDIDMDIDELLDEYCGRQGKLEIKSKFDNIMKKLSETQRHLKSAKREQQRAVNKARNIHINYNELVKKLNNKKEEIKQKDNANIVLADKLMKANNRNRELERDIDKKLNMVHKQQKILKQYENDKKRWMKIKKRK